MGNESVRNLMIHTYGNKCWLKGKVTRDNPLTYHHIDPVRKGGKCTFANGALLTVSKHQAFNKLEEMYPELAAQINTLFTVYHGDYPEDVWEKIEKLMMLVDRKYERTRRKVRRIDRHRK